VANAIELEVGGRRVRVTNPDKVYFAERGITKGDVVRYFLSVGEGILAAVRDRPTMLERWPGGMAGSAIFQRRIATGVPDWVQTAADGVYPTELAVVAWAASGGRGVHVAVPILPRWTYADVARAQEALARELVRRMPRQATMVRMKRDRGERVYVDHGQFLVAAAYSIRATARATVSAPVTWDELETAEPEDFDVTTMPARFAALGDLQAGLADDARSIEPLLEV
jgi:DNA primase